MFIVLKITYNQNQLINKYQNESKMNHFSQQTFKEC